MDKVVAIDDANSTFCAGHYVDDDLRSTLRSGVAVAVSYTVGVSFVLICAALFATYPDARFLWFALSMLLALPIWQTPTTAEHRVEVTLCHAFACCLGSLVTIGVEAVFHSLFPKDGLGCQRTAAHPGRAAARRTGVARYDAAELSSCADPDAGRSQHLCPPPRKNRGKPGESHQHGRRGDRRGAQRHPGPAPPSGWRGRSRTTNHNGRPGVGALRGGVGQSIGARRDGGRSAAGCGAADPGPGLPDRALRNALRHSQAERIEVEIHYESRPLRVHVRDDGKGIDPEILKAGGRAGHYGFPGITNAPIDLGANWTSGAKRGRAPKRC